MPDNIIDLIATDAKPNEIAIAITKHLVDEINKYHMLIKSTDMGSKMNKLKEKHE